MGGGPGISGACARLFAAEGMQVAIAQRTPDKPAIRDIVASSAEGRIHAYKCDAADADSVTALFAAVTSDLGPISCVVFNPSAAVRGAVVDIDAEEVKQAPGVARARSSSGGRA